MLKRIVACMLVMVMALSVTTAFAWTCPGCGTEAESKFCPECGTKRPENICPGCGTNHGDKVMKFCPECGTKMAAAVPTATAEPVPESQAPVISRIFENEDGTISLMWDADGETEYTVEIILCQSDDPQADRNANNNYYTSQGKSKIGFYTISKLIPGRSYWVGLFDEAGRGGYKLFTPLQQPEAFNAFSLQVISNPMIVQDGEQVTAASFGASDIAAGEPAGLYLVLDYDNPGESCPFVIQIAFTAPNAASWVTYSSGDFKQATKNKIGWRFLDLADYFDKLERGFGEVPIGEHQVDVYINGDLAGSASFAVTQGRSVQPTAAPTAVPTAVPTATPTAVPTAAPTAAHTMTSIKTTDNGDGTVQVTWEGGVAPFKVTYMEKVSSDYQADKSAENSLGTWVAETAVTENTYTLFRLAPGREYWITVVGSDERGRYIAYSSGQQVLEGYETSLEIIPRCQIDGKNYNLAAIPADKVGAEEDVSYGAFVRLDYNNPGETEEMLLQLVLTLPNGAVRVEQFADVMMENGTNSLGWNFLDLEWYFGQVRRAFGDIPEGDIQVDWYLDGKLAASGVLPVRVSKPLNVLGCQDQGNGHVLFSWEDNGNGPYRVYYHQRFSDDSAADRKHPLVPVRWIAEEDVTGNSLVIKHLIPGRNYWLTLQDSAGTETIIPYTAGVVVNADLNMTAESHPRKEKAEQITDLTAFSAAEINQADGTAFGLYIDLYYDPLPENCQKASKWIITLPNGVKFCELAFDMNMHASGSTYWEMYDLGWAFGKVMEWYGGMLQGEYKFDLYVEGKHSCSLTFTVGE